MTMQVLGRAIRNCSAAMILALFAGYGSAVATTRPAPAPLRLILQTGNLSPIEELILKRAQHWAEGCVCPDVGAACLDAG